MDSVVKTPIRGNSDSVSASVRVPISQLRVVIRQWSASAKECVDRPMIGDFDRVDPDEVQYFRVERRRECKRRQRWGGTLHEKRKIQYNGESVSREKHS
jgi:hypothetical protein